MAVIFAIDLVTLLTYFGMGLLLFVMRSHERIGLLVSFALVGFGFGAPELAPVLWDVYPFVYLGITALMFMVFSLVLYLYPDGVFTPRWTRWFALGGVLFVVPLMLLEDFAYRLNLPSPSQNIVVVRAVLLVCFPSAASSSVRCTATALLPHLRRNSSTNWPSLASAPR